MVSSENMGSDSMRCAAVLRVREIALLMSQIFVCLLKVNWNRIVDIGMDPAQMFLQFIAAISFDDKEVINMS